MANLDAALAWVGLEDSAARETKSSLWAALGGPTLVRHLAAIPFEVWSGAISGWEVTVLTGGPNALVRTPGTPTPVELGQVGTLRRVARLLMGLDPNETVAAGGGGAAGVGGGAVQQVAVAATTVERKIKLSAVLDQGDDTEVKPLDPVMIRTMIADWRELENDGENPQ